MKKHDFTIFFIILFIVICLITVIWVTEANRELPVPKDLGDFGIPVTIQGNTLIAISSHLGIPTLERIAEAGTKYGVDFMLLLDILECESGLKMESVGKACEVGIAQFKQSTFNHYCEGNFLSEEDQIMCIAKMISENRGYHWTCY